MRVGFTSLLAFGAMGTGCLLTTSLDGLDDSPAPLGGHDGATSAGDSGGLIDAADAATAADAPVDVDAQGPVDFRCASLPSVPVFCTDFDMGTVSSIIGAPTTDLGGEVKLDSLVFRSSSRSLALTAPAAATGVGRANVGRTFGFAPQNSISVDLDLRLDSIDKSSVNTLSISMGSYDLSLFLGGSAKLREGVPGDGGTIYTATDQSPPKAGAWVHLSLAVVLASGASKATVSYDGVPLGSIPLVIEAYRASSWSVDLGLNYITTPDDGRELHIDNLVIDAK
jgi:hypothetical protein